MPMYLKRDAIRFIEASVSAISMAVAALGMPRRYDFREVAAERIGRSSRGRFITEKIYLSGRMEFLIIWMRRKEIKY